MTARERLAQFDDVIVWLQGQRAKLAEQVARDEALTPLAPHFGQTGSHEPDASSAPSCPH